MNFQNQNNKKFSITFYIKPVAITYLFMVFPMHCNNRSHNPALLVIIQVPAQISYKVLEYFCFFFINIDCAFIFYSAFVIYMNNNYRALTIFVKRKNNCSSFVHRTYLFWEVYSKLLSFFLTFLCLWKRYSEKVHETTRRTTTVTSVLILTKPATLKYYTIIGALQWFLRNLQNTYSLEHLQTTASVLTFRIFILQTTLI